MSDTVGLIFGKEDSRTEQEISELAEVVKAAGIKRNPAMFARFIYTLDKTKTCHPSIDREAFLLTLQEVWEEKGLQGLSLAEEIYQRGFTR